MPFHPCHVPFHLETAVLVNRTNRQNPSNSNTSNIRQSSTTLLCCTNTHLRVPKFCDSLPFTRAAAPPFTGPFRHHARCTGTVENRKIIFYPIGHFLDGFERTTFFFLLFHATFNRTITIAHRLRCTVGWRIEPTTGNQTTKKVLHQRKKEQQNQNGKQCSVIQCHHQANNKTEAEKHSDPPDWSPFGLFFGS